MLQGLFQLDHGILIVSAPEIENTEIVVSVTQPILLSQALAQKIIRLGILGEIAGYLQKTVRGACQIAHFHLGAPQIKLAFGVLGNRGTGTFQDF